ncbi:unnamed protein product [Heterobilharzia americana]|nr:unnamed protein product [Heterobilharzia americana]
MTIWSVKPLCKVGSRLLKSILLLDAKSHNQTKNGNKESMKTFAPETPVKQNENLKDKVPRNSCSNY